MNPSTPAPATSQDALNQLTQYQGSLQSPQAALDAAKGSLGVAGAQSTATGLQGAIQNTTNLLGQVAPSVYGRTGNSLVTTAQAGQQIQNAEAPLNATLAKEGTDYGNAEQNYHDLLGQADTEAQNTLSDQSTREGYLQNIYNDLYGKETDASKLAEQQREFDQQLQASKDASASSTAGLASLLGGSSTSAATTPAAGGTLSGGKTSDQAASAVHSLLQTNDPNTIINTYNAIKSSAAKGNSYDAAKLQLLQQFAPGLFKNGDLNTAYLQNTALAGIKLF